MKILAIESSCDDTSSAVMRDARPLSNVTASQAVHERYGGVVPELASRAHEKNIVPVVDAALRDAGVAAADLDAVAFTRGPGLPGSLLVGVSFAKGLALALDKPLIEVDHLLGHIAAHYIDDEAQRQPPFPFLCLLVSGGNSQIVEVRAPLEMRIIGHTIDDAAGEAFDKCAKVMNLGYPGGPVVDKLARTGNPDAFHFARPRVEGYNYSFSGLKTSFLYTLRDALPGAPDFVEHHKADLCASLQRCVVQTLMDKLLRASRDLRITTLAVAGGVSANSELRKAFNDLAAQGFDTYIPKFAYTTDNAAMIGAAAYHKYQAGLFCSQDVAPYSRTLI